jgi:DNA-binding NarL/FixJ family response regulator
MKTSLRKIRVSRPAAHPTFPLTRKPSISSAPAGKKRVLVIEDQSAVCDLVAEMIHAHPRCDLAGKGSDGESAVELALQLRPDILVLDVIMPGVGGIEVLRRLGGSLPAMKVLIFSGKQ